MKANFSLLHIISIFVLPLFAVPVAGASLVADGQGFSADEADRRFVLVIDAGHGGHDAGAVGSFSKEKNINLKVALAFGRLVEQNCRDVKVVYTRRTDVFIPLQTRADIANRNKADLFISVHTNALAAGRIAYGSETYTLGMARAAANLEVAKRENSVITFEKDYQTTYEGFDPNRTESYIIFELMQDRYMKQSVDLARNIQRQYVKAGRKDKGVHQAGFLVLRRTSMPAVLTELGFISTPAEEQYLNSAEGVSQLSQSLFNGFINYRREHEQNPAALPSPIVIDPPSSPEPKEEAVESVPAEPKPQPESRRQSKHNEEKSAKVSASDIRFDVEEKKTAKSGKSSSTTGKKSLAVEKQSDMPEKSRAAAEKQSDSSEKQSDKAEEENGIPVFKVQFLAGSARIKAGDSRFKGLKDVDCYEESGMYKYTVGNTADYKEALKLRREVAKTFPQAFVVAFASGKRMDLGQAIRSAGKK